MQTRFMRDFWLGAPVAAAVLLGALHFWWTPERNHLPPRLPFPWPSQSFVSYYEPSGSAEHPLFRFGLFGTARRLRQSDVVLLGASHTIFGMSAAAISGQLSQAEGRPIRVYNLGMVYGEGAMFPAKILNRLRVRDKIAVIDLFSECGPGITRPAAHVDHENILQAYADIGKIWGDFLRDWALDAWLPCLHGPVPHRFLGTVQTRLFASGDTARLWTPAWGDFYFAPPASLVHPLRSRDGMTQFPNRGASFPAGAEALLRRNGIRPVLTLLPYEGSSRAEIPPTPYPYIPVSPEGLLYFDEHHVVAAGRALVSQRIAEGLERQPGLFLPPPR